MYEENTEKSIVKQIVIACFHLILACDKLSGGFIINKFWEF